MRNMKLQSNPAVQCMCVVSSHVAFLVIALKAIAQGTKRTKPISAAQNIISDIPMTKIPDSP